MTKNVISTFFMGTQKVKKFSIYPQKFLTTSF